MWRHNPGVAARGVARAAERAAALEADRAAASAAAAAAVARLESPDESDYVHVSPSSIGEGDMDGTAGHKASTTCAVVDGIVVRLG